MMPTKVFGGLVLFALALFPACPGSGQERPTLFGTMFDAEESQYAQPYTDLIEEIPYLNSDEIARDFDNDEPIKPSFGPRLDVDGIFGNRPGVNNNDYSVGAFLPWHLTPDQHVTFLMLRGTATDAGNFAGSVGIGERIYLHETNRIVGISVWCDADDAHRQTYYRAGGQLEIIGSQLELRTGADLIVGNKQWSNDPFARAETFFTGNNIHVGLFKESERAFDQAYVELGGPLPKIAGRRINAYAGAYYLWNEPSDGNVGWQARTSAALTDAIHVGAQLTHDRPFGVNASAYVSFAIPTGGMRQVFRSPRVRIRGQSADESEPSRRSDSIVNQLANNVVRGFRIPVQRESSIESHAAINPDNRHYITVMHVDPNAATEGDGSFERPFRTLEAARLANSANTQIIHVVTPTNGSTTNLELSAPLQLFDSQRLLSSSVPHLVATAQQGVLSLPGYTGGPAPILTNNQPAASSVVQMVDQTEVSGFQIDGDGRHVGLQGNIRGFNINRNLILNATNGVQMSNASGEGLIDSNTFQNNTHDGVNITVTNGDTLNLLVSNNTGSRNGDDAIDVTVTGSELSASFEGNKLGANGKHGLALTSRSNSTITAMLQRNELGQTSTGLDGNAGAGFRFDSDSGFAHLTIGGSVEDEGNIVQGNTRDSLAFHLTDSALAIVDEQNNTITPPTSSSNRFNIVIEFGGGLTAAQQAAFAAAEQRWESIIIGDLANVGAIDDVHIFADADVLDGAGGTLAEALPTGLRADSYLPFQGVMHIDSSDLGMLQATGELNDIILHEMAHVLGFGSIWEQKGLVSGIGSADPRFTGVQATAEFNAQFGMNASGVPLETTGGPGTANSHWLETVYGDELMTGFISGAVRPLSRTTAAQFADLGYLIDINQADP